jgi:HKD family nuclease
VLRHELLLSNVSSAEYASLLDAALTAGTDYQEFTASCAYATMGGVAEFDRRCRSALGTAWEKIKKSWIIGVDYCRSEPVALECLAAMPRSEVRVPNGKLLVARRMCIPNATYHPKVFAFEGRSTRALLLGSGNLSRNGLTTGIEAGCIIAATAPLTVDEQSVADKLADVRKGIARLWTTSTPYGTIRAAYNQCFNAVDNLRNPTPTDDDSSETELTASRAGRRRSEVSAQRLKQMRACRQLWIEAGNLHENRGKGKPGNQLMLSRMSRVFFGFPASDVPIDSYIGSVSLRYGVHFREDCPLRFSNNSMDVLTLPIPDAEGPTAYDGETLLFRTTGLNTFTLTIGGSKDKAKWERQSQRIEATFKMSSGRKWGVF